MPSAVPKRRILYAGCPGSGRRTSLGCLLDTTGAGEQLSLRWGEGATARELEIRVLDLSSIGAAPGVPVTRPPDGWQDRQQAFLAELDGIVLVVDPRRDRLEANDTELGRLSAALRHAGADPGSVPLVFQLNKLDLPLDAQGASHFAEITGSHEQPAVLVRAPIAILRQRLRWPRCDFVETMAAAGVSVHQAIEKLMAMCDLRRRGGGSG